MSIVHTANGRRRLVGAAAYCLTSSLIASTGHAGHCSSEGQGYLSGGYPIRSALPYIGVRHVTVGKDLHTSGGPGQDQHDHAASGPKPSALALPCTGERSEYEPRIPGNRSLPVHQRQQPRTTHGDET